MLKSLLMLKGIERVHLNTPLSLANAFERPNLRFGTFANTDNDGASARQRIRELSDLVNRRPSVLDPLTITSISRNTLILPGGDERPTSVTNTTYERIYDGTFSIPWLVIVGVDQGQVSVEYEAQLERPDSSLAYILNHSKKPDFLAQPAGDVKYNSYPKRRTRIDGLLVWIRVDEWEDDAPENKFAPEAKRLALTHKHSDPQPFSRKNGEHAILEHTDRFVGSWHESWSLVDSGSGSKLSRMEVVLEGQWE